MIIIIIPIHITSLANNRLTINSPAINRLAINRLANVAINRLVRGHCVPHLSVFIKKNVLKGTIR